MWSFACILAELYTGSTYPSPPCVHQAGGKTVGVSAGRGGGRFPIFPGENETEQLACIMEVMGAPPRALVEEASRRKMFFDSAGAPRIVANSRGKKRRPGAKDMASALRCKDPAFVSFLESCLRWDKRDRLTPEQASSPAPARG